MGSCGREVPHETQFMLLEGPSENFTVLLPIIDGAFRACLLGNTENFLQLCVESGEYDLNDKFFYICTLLLSQCNVLP